MKKLDHDFYNRSNVLLIAKELLGCILVTRFNNQYTSGRIVETEAYVAITDKASHSFGGKRTQRNEPMYADAATTYMYICYGIHHLFNIVTNKKDVPDAVLIRALEPIEGIDIMLHRTGKKQFDNTLTRGPGNLSKAMGLQKVHSGIRLLGNEIYVQQDPQFEGKESIAASKRIGIDGAGDAALLPYRFYIRGNKFISGSPK